jgi:hypothetical protein
LKKCEKPHLSRLRRDIQSSLHKPKGSFSNEEDDTEERGGEQAANSEEIEEGGSAKRESAYAESEEHPV